VLPQNCGIIVARILSGGALTSCPKSGDLSSYHPLTCATKCLYCQLTIKFLHLDPSSYSLLCRPEVHRDQITPPRKNLDRPKHFMSHKKTKPENVAIANALQLEAARRRAVPIPSILVSRAKFEVAQPIRCRLRAFYCSYFTLRCDLELWPRDLDLWPLSFNIVTTSYPLLPLARSIYLYCLQQKCSPKNLAFSNIWFMETFAEVTENGCITDRHLLSKSSNMTNTPRELGNSNRNRAQL